VVAIEQSDIRRLIDQAPKDSRFFAGLMLWQPDELEDEIDAGAWEVRPAQTAMVFSANPAHLWKALYRGAGQVEANAGSLAAARTLAAIGIESRVSVDQSMEGTEERAYPAMRTGAER
jgi:hypothetical protein